MQIGTSGIYEKPGNAENPFAAQMSHQAIIQRYFDERRQNWWGRPDLNRRFTGIAAPLENHPRTRVIKLFIV
jgi:hypothetical protein